MEAQKYKIGTPMKTCPIIKVDREGSDWFLAAQMTNCRDFIITNLP